MIQNHRAKKSLGQNFLTNSAIIKKIIEVCDLKKDDVVLEIGPGKGAITEGIASRVKQVLAVEADHTLAKYLHEKFTGTNITVFSEDILKFDFEKLPDNIKLISNLPYNIATPIIEKVIAHRRKFNQFFMMVQLEYGQRMCAVPGNKTYGSFSCFVQYYGLPEILFKIGRGAFQPMPKVQSCFIKYDLFKKLPQEFHIEERLFMIIRTAFQQRRKTILNSLNGFADKASLEKIFVKLGIDSQDRAESLSLGQYIKIAGELDVICHSANL
ncbi:MAG: ribosomal RNA small subunit methyltransferase A [Candidatus Omnitrophica bacterium]|nr:ribosomal RNA small subunit methyltransferase A [Candidatus Omnitrophota bacterium]